MTNHPIPNLHNEAPSLGERALVVLVLFLSTGAFMNLTYSASEKQNTGMIGMQILWLLLYIVTLSFYSRKCSRPVASFLSEWPLVLVIAFTLTSALWSLDPGMTVRRSLALVFTFLFGVYFASRFSLGEQLRLLAWVCAACVILSFAFQVLGLNPSEGVPGWYGIFYMKNDLGRVMVLSALVFLFWKRAEPQHAGLARAGFLTSVAMIALSRSMTAVVSFGLVMILLPYLRWTLKKSARWAIAGIAVLLTAGSLGLLYVATHIEQVTGLVGKSATLTGRVPLWILSVVMALRRPWLGYGYYGFWQPQEWAVERIWHLLGWKPPHAHNGYIELWIDLGLIGACLFFLVFAYYFAKTIPFLRDNHDNIGAWPLAFFVFLLFANVTDTFFLTRNSIFFILYVSLAVNLHAARAPVPSAVKLSAPRESYA